MHFLFLVCFIDRFRSIGKWGSDLDNAFITRVRLNELFIRNRALFWCNLMKNRLGMGDDAIDWCRLWWTIAEISLAYNRHSQTEKMKPMDSEAAGVIDHHHGRIIWHGIGLFNVRGGGFYSLLSRSCILNEIEARWKVAASCCLAAADDAMCEGSVMTAGHFLGNVHSKIMLLDCLMNAGRSSQFHYSNPSHKFWPHRGEGWTREIGSLRDKAKNTGKRDSGATNGLRTKSHPSLNTLNLKKGPTVPARS